MSELQKDQAVPEMIAEMIWLAVGVYASAGMLVVVWLFAGGLARIDTQAAAAPAHVKALWALGFVALWPALLWRACGGAPPEDRLRIHRERRT